MADNHETPVARSARLLRQAIEQQSSEPEDAAMVTMWIAARAVLRVLSVPMAKR